MLAKELLGSAALEVLAVERCRTGAWWNFHDVMSPFSRLWLPLNGPAQVTHHGREFQLTPGSMHLIPAFTLHSHRCRRPFDLCFLHFTSRLKTGIDLMAVHEMDYQLPAGPETLRLFRQLEAIFPERKLPVYDPFRDEYRRFPARVAELEARTSPVDAFEAEGVLRQLVAPFLRTWHGEPAEHATLAGRYLVVQEFIHEHLAERISLKDLARVAGLNPTYFSDAFRQTIGVRPLAYLTRRRMERAQYLLATTQNSVKQVAQEAGFPDASHFSRVFARHCRMSPLQYRQRNSL
jgi:AraC-like DNA-binding protein/mannose-6-phosphate isomerase-like protein (cupin superfamily)